MKTSIHTKIYLNVCAKAWRESNPHTEKGVKLKEVMLASFKEQKGL